MNGGHQKYHYSILSLIAVWFLLLPHAKATPNSKLFEFASTVKNKGEFNTLVNRLEKVNSNRQDDEMIFGNSPYLKSRAKNITTLDDVLRFINKGSSGLPISATWVILKNCANPEIRERALKLWMLTHQTDLYVSSHLIDIFGLLESIRNPSVVNEIWLDDRDNRAISALASLTKERMGDYSDRRLVEDVSKALIKMADFTVGRNWLDERFNDVKIKMEAEVRDFRAVEKKNRNPLRSLKAGLAPLSWLNQTFPLATKLGLGYAVGSAIDYSINASGMTGWGMTLGGGITFGLTGGFGLSWLSGELASQKGQNLPRIGAFSILAAGVFGGIGILGDIIAEVAGVAPHAATIELTTAGLLTGIFHKLSNSPDDELSINRQDDVYTIDRKKAERRLKLLKNLEATVFRSSATDGEPHGTHCDGAFRSTAN